MPGSWSRGGRFFGRWTRSKLLGYRGRVKRNQGISGQMDGTALRMEALAVPSLPFLSNHKNPLLDVGAGGYVGEGEHFPAFRQGSGGSAAVRACPIVHIS